MGYFRRQQEYPVFVDTALQMGAAVEMPLEPKVARACNESRKRGSVSGVDLDVFHRSHHPCGHVVHVVAMQGPFPRIVGIESDGDTFHWRHQDGIAHRAS